MKRRVQGLKSICCKTSWTATLCALLVCGTPIVWAQLPTATILGVVKDGTGAVVPDATFTARTLETGQSRTAVSGGDGSYRFSALPVGNYEVRVEHPGFRAEVRSGLTLSVSQEAVVNFTLQIGAIEQTVEVTAEAPLINTTSGSLGGLVNEQQVTDLPLNGRNFIDLTLIQTGVQQHQNRSSAGGMYGVWFSSNGAPVRSNSLLLDGASMRTLWGASSASVSGATLGIDGIREYRVVTNSFSAEYGMTMGSQTMIVSNSGTNVFHGSLFEYLRNSALDARNFFDRKTVANTRRLPAFTRNNFGGSLGGPIKRDKTFFHVTFETLRERLGVTTVDNVIASSAKVDGGLVSQIAPIVKPWLALYPDPNLPGDQFTFPFTQPTTVNYGQVRLDHNLSDSDSVFGRYTVDDTEQTRTLAYPQFKQNLVGRNQFITVSENHIFSPTLLNTFRFSFSRTRYFSDSPSGLIGPQFSFVSGQEYGGVSILGITGLGPEGTSPFKGTQNIFAWSDDLFYTRGRHSLKFGTLINRYQQYMLNSAGTRGGITFPTLIAFLLARPSFYSGVSPGSISDRTYHLSTLGFYLQDDLRITPTFVLNLGLRYEFMTQIREVNGLGLGLVDPVRDASFTPGIPFRNPTRKDFSPRFGFAWDVMGDGLTSVRGGFGVYYNIGDYASELVGPIFANPPISSFSTVVNPPTLSLPLFFPPEAAAKSIRSVEYNLQSAHLLSYNLTVERQLPFGMGLTLAYAGSRGINIMQTKEGNPTIPQVRPDGRQFWAGNEPRTNRKWSTHTMQASAGNSWYNSLQISLRKQLGRGLQFQSSYTWSKLIDETQAGFNADSTNSNVVGSDPTHRTVDRGRADFDITQNWRMNAIYRLPNLVSSRGVAEKVLNGWWASAILSFQSGAPLTPVLGTNRSRSAVGGGGGNIDRPNLVVGRNGANIVSGTTAGCQGVLPGQKLGTPTLYFDPCAFTIPVAGFLGTAGRTILRGPGIANVDFSIVKDTGLGFLGESAKLEFRAEAFNIFNRVNFGLPNRTVYAARADLEPAIATAGVITTASTSRQVQLALKIVF